LHIEDGVEISRCVSTFWQVIPGPEILLPPSGFLAYSQDFNMGKGINEGAEAPEVVHDATVDKKDIAHVERTLSGTDEKGDHVNYDRIDDEVAKYANASGDAIIITEEENKRLKSLIDRRVLPIMMFTYFLQALDKGTMSFTSIMGIRDDIPILLKSSHVSQSSYSI
jgi:hypothetical protein